MTHHNQGMAAASLVTNNLHKNLESLIATSAQALHLLVRAEVVAANIAIANAVAPEPATDISYWHLSGGRWEATRIIKP